MLAIKNGEKKFGCFKGIEKISEVLNYTCLLVPYKGIEQGIKLRCHFHLRYFLNIGNDEFLLACSVDNLI
jgi:hypothetical protein